MSTALCRAKTPGAGSGALIGPSLMRRSAELALRRPRHQALPVREHHRAEGRGDEQGTGDLEGPDVVAEDQGGHGGDVAVPIDAVEPHRGRQDDMRQHADEQRRHAQAEQHRGAPLALDRLDQGVGGVDPDQHDHEQEQHHDRAGVDEDLHAAQEGRLLGEVHDSEAHHHDRHAQRGVHGLLGEQQAEGAHHHDRCEHPEEDGLPATHHRATLPSTDGFPAMCPDARSASGDPGSAASAPRRASTHAFCSAVASVTCPR